MEPAHAAQHRTAFLFLCHLILYRRPEEERSDLMSLIGAYTKDVEVDKVIKSAAETLIERGIERGKIEEKQDFLIRLLRKRINVVSDTTINQIRSIQDLSELDNLFDQVDEANSLEDINLPNKDGE